MWGIWIVGGSPFWFLGDRYSRRMGVEPYPVASWDGFPVYSGTGIPCCLPVNILTHTTESIAFLSYVLGKKYFLLC